MQSSRQLLCRIVAYAFTLGMAGAAMADVPRLIHYQGKLITSSGSIVPGPANLRARLYESPTGSSPVLFDETHAAVPLNRGLFSVLLGAQTPGGVPDSVVSGEFVYLGVAVDGAAELSPRIRIACSPFATKSKSSEQLVRPGTTSAEVSVGAGGGVAIGTASADPSAKVDIASDSQGLLIPRLTEAQRDAIGSPAVGLLIFNTTSSCINMWTGVSWKQSCFECSFSPPVTGNNGPLCEGSTLNLTASTIAGAAYAWSGPNGFTSSSQNPSIPNATAAASGPYSVVATLNGCSASPVSTVATVNATPAPPTAGNNGPLCAGDTLDLTASTVAGASYDWTGPNGFASSDQNPSLANVTAAAAGNYNVSVTVNGCTSTAASTSVAVGAIPNMPGAITGQTSLCSGTSGVQYSVADVPGATSYAWTVPSGASITNGQGTAFITVTFGGTSGNVTVAAVNACGSSSPSTLAVTVSGGPGSQTFTSSGTFTVPACVGTVRVAVVGGGGGGSAGHGGGGGSGHVRTGTYNVSGAISVTVGGGGSGGSPSCGAGGSGSSSSFGAFLSASGGSGGQGCDRGGNGGSGGGGAGNDGCGGAGGSGGSNGASGCTYPGGSGGNFDSLAGFSVSALTAGAGGAAGNTSHSGGGGGGGLRINGGGANGGDGSNANSGKGGLGYGAGGGGGGYAGPYYVGGAGAPGVVYIEW